MLATFKTAAEEHFFSIVLYQQMAHGRIWDLVMMPPSYTLQPMCMNIELLKAFGSRVENSSCKAQLKHFERPFH